MEKFINISKETFDNKKHKLAIDKKILCYNSDGSLMFEFLGLKVDFLKKYKYPGSVWNAAIKEKVF